MPASVTASLSVSHFVNSVGAKAGFASIIGLAILVLLYFAHARETASLRDQLADAAQRIARLESRLSQLRVRPRQLRPTRGNAEAPGPAPCRTRPRAGRPAAAAARRRADPVAGDRRPVPRPVPQPPQPTRRSERWPSPTRRWRRPESGRRR